MISKFPLQYLVNGYNQEFKIREEAVCNLLARLYSQFDPFLNALSQIGWVDFAANQKRLLQFGFYSILLESRLLIRDVDIHLGHPFFVHTIWSIAGVVSVDFPQTNGTIFFSLIFSECSYMYCILMKQGIDFLKTKPNVVHT